MTKVVDGAAAERHDTDVPRRGPGSDGCARRRVAVDELLAQCTTEPVVVRRVVVPRAEVVYVKGILEASEGLGSLFALHGGELTLVTSRELGGQLDELLADLSEEIGLRVRHPQAHRTVDGAPLIDDSTGG